MTERYIPGVPCWADATYPDAAAAAGFYTGLFGWECEDTMPADAPGNYFQASLDGGRVAAVASLPGGTGAPAWTSYVWVDDADATTEAAQAAGGTVVVGPEDIPGSGRFAVFADPQGAVIGVWEPGEHRGATTVNAHGAVVFNDLYTTDVQGAASFYGDVFGWDLTELFGSHMWTMTAYGDHLESMNPGMRAQSEQMGAAGWENVVASVQPTEAPARWGITFATEDVDATVARAAELGAAVVSGPTKTAWVRVADLVDPQGVAFTVSQFSPEST